MVVEGFELTMGGSDCFCVVAQGWLELGLYAVPAVAVDVCFGLVGWVTVGTAAGFDWVRAWAVPVLRRLAKGQWNGEPVG